MRFLRVLIPALLVISLAANLFMWQRWRKTRRIMAINGQEVTEKDVTDYLQQEKGPIVKKELTERILIDQQAQKNHLVPTQAEIDEKFNEQKELNYQFARTLMVAPWYEAEAKTNIRIKLETLRLLTMDVQVSDEDIRDEYNQHPQNYDTPDKARVNLAVIKDVSHQAEVKHLMEQNIAPADINRDFVGSAEFWGDNFVYTFVRHFGTNEFAPIFSMKPNQVKEIPPGPQEQQQGIRGLVVRMLEIVPGHKFDPNDGKARENIRLAVASKRMKPLEEWLSAVWADAKFDSEDKGDRDLIARLMFPDRASRQAGH
jgi:hypothetical protein